MIFRDNLDTVGITPALTYILLVGITVIFISIVVSSVTTLVDTQQDTATQIEMNIIGTQVASEIEQYSRISTQFSGDSTKDVQAFPSEARTQYRLSVESTGEPDIYILQLEETGLGNNITIEKRIHSPTPINTDSEAISPNVQLQYNSSTGELEFNSELEAAIRSN